MAQPTPYVPQNSFSGSDAWRGAEIDVELARIKQTTDEVLTNLALIQRDDGEVANETIGLDQLKPEIRTGIAAAAGLVEQAVADAIEAYGVASQPEAEAGTDNAAIMTPLRTAQQVTARLASQGEAEAGTDNTKLMTPLRSAQQVTARIASLAEAQAGTDTTKLLTPQRGMDLITARGKEAAFTQSGTGAVARTVDEKLRDSIRSIQDFGTSADWAAAATAARAAAGVNEPIVLEKGGSKAYAQSQTQSVYGADFDDALGEQVLLGTSVAPATRHEPIYWVEKVSASDRNTIATAWDHGAIYGSLQKVGGDAFGAAITGYAVYTGGSGDLVGVHGRARGTASGAQIFGGWSYADCATTTPNRVIGHEIDVRNQTVEAPLWSADAASGDLTGLLVALADGLYGAQHGIRLTSKGGNQKWWTGFQVGRDVIQPIDANGDGEAIRIRGSASTLNRYGGIAIGDRDGAHNFQYGLRFFHGSFANNCAAWLAKSHRLTWGTAVSAGSFVTVQANSSGSGADELILGGNDFVHPIFRVPAAAPTFTLSRQVSFSYINDTTLRLYMEGADGTMRSIDLTLS